MGVWTPNPPVVAPLVSTWSDKVSPDAEGNIRSQECCQGGRDQVDSVIVE